MILAPIPLLLSLHVPAGPVVGRCVEARTASVFAGACHYGAEATTAGREALIVWRFESGMHAGVDLAGACVAAAVAGEANLAEPGTSRRSVLYASERMSAEQERAALDLLRARCAQALGRVLEVRRVDLAASFDGDSYEVRAADLFRLQGEALPDRACCKMPLNVWYRPFTALERRVVGQNAVFSFADERLGPRWARFDENTGFLGTFRFDASPPNEAAAE